MLDPRFIERLNKIEWENMIIKQILTDFMKLKFPNNLNYQKLVQDLKEVLMEDDHVSMQQQ